MKALVVFHDHGTHPLARFLKPGFKHCFVAVEADGNWITLDGRAGLPVVEIVAPADYDLATFYRSRGYAVIETEQRGRVPLTPFLPRNCVGLVKGILAIGGLMVITPWQLYTHLARAESPGLQLLPGESDTGPDKPGKDTKALRGIAGAIPGAGKAVDFAKESQRSGAPNRRKQPSEDQRDGGVKLDVTVQASDAGELGGGDSGSKTTPSKGDDKRGGRAATLLSASKGIRDKLGRSGKRAPGKSLG